MNSSLLEACGSRCAPLAWRGTSGDRWCETPTEVVLRSPLWMVSIKHKLTLYAEAVKERTIRVLINVSQIPRTLRNVILGKCPLISSSKANSCHHRTKPTRYFPGSASYFSFSNKLTKMALLIILRYCIFKTNKVTNRVITLEICLKSLLYSFENLFNCDSSSQFS